MSDAPHREELDRTSALPLWAQLRDRLSARLDAGEFAVAFPAENDLAAQYAVSRNTVREAMRRLRADGVVVAERGRRPRLATPSEIEQPLGAIYSLFASVEAAGLEQHSVVRAADLRVDASVAQRLGRDPAAPLFYLERVRLAGGQPLALDRVWMAGDVGGALVGVDFTHTALYVELYRLTGLRLTAGREWVRAVVPSPQDRSLLELGPDQAALAIDRLASVHEDRVEWRRTLIRGDRFSLVAEFSARTGYQFDAAAMSLPESAPLAEGDARDASSDVA